MIINFFAAVLVAAFYRLRESEITHDAIGEMSEQEEAS